MGTIARIPTGDAQHAEYRAAHRKIVFASADDRKKQVATSEQEANKVDAPIPR